MTTKQINHGMGWSAVKDIVKNHKPSWDSAPSGAQFMGVPTYGPYMGVWCWFSGSKPAMVEFIERRPSGK